MFVAALGQDGLQAGDHRGTPRMGTEQTAARYRRTSVPATANSPGRAPCEYFSNRNIVVAPRQGHGHVNGYRHPSFSPTNAYRVGAALRDGAATLNSPIGTPPVCAKFVNPGWLADDLTTCGRIRGPGHISDFDSARQHCQTTRSRVWCSAIYVGSATPGGFGCFGLRWFSWRPRWRPRRVRVHRPKLVTRTCRLSAWQGTRVSS